MTWPSVTTSTVAVLARAKDRLQGLLAVLDISRETKLPTVLHRS
ncbi:hypothetical protein AB0D11_48875 [Streptomyces monashensis]